MSKKFSYTFKDDLAESLKDPEFRQAWKDSEPEYLLAKKIIEKRLANKLSQRALAKKLGTSQAVVSRLETMTANPTLSLLQRVSKALGTKLVITIS